MQIIEQGHEILNTSSDNLVDFIANRARACYKSEDKATPEKNEALIEMLIRKGHHSQLEHGNMTVKLITDRGVTHELVRHRLASFSQESTRYCRYDNGHMQFIRPVWADKEVLGKWKSNMFLGEEKFTYPADFLWFLSCLTSEGAYGELLSKTWSPQQARSVLNHSLKTEIDVTANVREWRHILDLRCSKQAHPQIRGLFNGVLTDFTNRFPALFKDIYDKYAEGEN